MDIRCCDNTMMMWHVIESIITRMNEYITRTQIVVQILLVLSYNVSVYNSLLFLHAMGSCAMYKSF